MEFITARIDMQNLQKILEKHTISDSDCCAIFTKAGDALIIIPDTTLQSWLLKEPNFYRMEMKDEALRRLQISGDYTTMGNQQLLPF